MYFRHPPISKEQSKLASSEIGSVYNTRYLGLNTTIYLNKSAGVLKKSFGIFFCFFVVSLGFFGVLVSVFWGFGWGFMSTLDSSGNGFKLLWF